MNIIYIQQVAKLPLPESITWISLPLRETLDEDGRITVEYLEERGEYKVRYPLSTQGYNDDHILRHTS
jgi:hypothetical protein